jgi:hypothetical protein
MLTSIRDTAARIKKSRKTNQTKFKVRCNRFLYTLVLKDADKADKLKQSLPPGSFNHAHPVDETKVEGKY